MQLLQIIKLNLQKIQKKSTLFHFRKVRKKLSHRQFYHKINKEVANFIYKYCIKNPHNHHEKSSLRTQTRAS